MERFALEFVLRAILIAAGAGLVLRVLRIRAAAAQHAFWTGVLIALLSLPIWILWGPKAALPLLPARGGPVVVVTAAPVQIADRSRTVVVPMRTEVSESAPGPGWNWNLTWIGIYLLGSGLLLMRLAIGTIRASRLDSDSCAAPVTVGLLRPRVILPNGWREWPRGQLDAVLAHEQAHARRRDPLVLWLALLNRALFWFHPLAWWLERRITALAEEACDAAVLEQGHAPRDYAGYLLELARAVQRAGVRVNVTGMAMPGSYLPRRVRKIIAGVSVPRVSPARMAFAVITCVVCSMMFAAGTVEHVAQIQFPAIQTPEARVPIPQLVEPARKSIPVMLAQAATAPPPVRPPKKPLNFDVASVKPTPVPAAVNILPGGGMTVRKGTGNLPLIRETGGPGTDDPGRIHYPLISLKSLLGRAYDSYSEIKGPGWLDSEMVQVDATMPPDTTKEQFREMLGNLITDRFKLEFHVETKETTGYSLVAAKGGPKMKASVEAPAPPEPDGNAVPRPPQMGPDGFPVISQSAGHIFNIQFAPGERLRFFAQQVMIEELTHAVAVALHSTVTDATGLDGKYDFILYFAGGGGRGGPFYAAVPAADPPSGGSASTAAIVPGASDPFPDIFSALQSQLGLKLEPKKIPVQVMVVDHMERTPSSN